MRGAVALLSAGFVAVACTATKPPEPAQPPRAVAPAPTLPDIDAWKKDWPKTWTDPRVVDALALHCDFDPKTKPPDNGGFDTPPDLFHCTIGYEQSCRPDVCFSASFACEGDCTSSCLDCGGTCASACTSCKARCTDAACIRACAATCAECKQACTAKLDTCTSGACGKVYAACEKRLEEAYKKAQCRTKYKQWMRCVEPCDTTKTTTTEACFRRCDEIIAPGFEQCNAPCEALRTEGKDDAANACLLECYIVKPCAPFVCSMFYGSGP